MDADILEGLPSLEESVAEAASAEAPSAKAASAEATIAEPASTSTPELMTDAVPATPVDAASVEPEPQVVNEIPEEAPLAVSNKPESVEKTPEIAPVEAAPSVDVTAKEKGEPVKSVEEKAAATAPSGGFQIPEGPRVDVSAATVARMMGIASTNDLRVLEGRIDLLTSKVAAILTKMDRCLSMFTSIPTASDIGRLEVQLAAVKSMMKELLDSVGAPVGGAKEQADKQAAAEQSRKLREGIKTNTES